MALSLMDGNEAIAWGANASGCGFFAGYPITPATSINNTMLTLLPPRGGVCIQGEDEIASIGYCLGASMAGLKAMTATSGPGISLYSEQLSFAVGSEIPIVIVDVMRLGPSTGSATLAADGDVNFLRWNSSGGTPVIVLAPVDVKDCFTLTMHAFNLAETYRCPVFIASNKDIALTKESVDLSSIEKPEVVERTKAPEDKPFLPFEADENTGVPGFVPIGDQTLARQTSSTHGPDGYITADPAVIQKNQERLQAKIESAVDSFTYYDANLEEGADTLVITYGITARAAKAACEAMTAQGTPVSLLVLKTLWPSPEKIIRETAQSHKKVLVLEMNMGQYVHEVERILPDKAVRFKGQMNGKLITPRQIEEELTHG